MLEEANTLLAQKQEVEIKQQLLNSFNKHFVLSSEELEVLSMVNLEVDEQFFMLLARLKRIHADCKVLLGSENQELGLELMEQSSRYLNEAFQKLYRWIQKEFKTLDLENPRMNAPIRRALRILAEQPTLFQNCLDHFAEARERNLSDAFYAALTGVSNQTDDRTAKPMDYYAHDALRFIGDMLAWTHSAAVSERESLEVLFISEGDEMAKGIKTGIESEPWLYDNAKSFDGQKSLDQLVNRDLSGVARALRQRVEQVIKSDDDTVLAFKIASLIEFYCVTFSRMLGSDSGVLETLNSLQKSAMQQYRVTMKDISSAATTENTQVPADLSPPDYLIDALARLRELMKSYDSSFTPPESREAVFQPIFTEALDPFLDTSKELATQMKEPSNSIFAVNCMCMAKAAIAQYDFTATKISDLDKELDDSASKLVDYQHTFLVYTSGLHPLLAAIAPLTETEEDLSSIPTLPQFQKDALADASQTLDDFLPVALMDAAENIKRLKDATMAEDITAEAAARFCEDFDLVEDRLIAADRLLGEVGESEDGQTTRTTLRSIFPRTSGEIRVLLS